MKRVILLALMCFLFMNELYSQTLIATSGYADATANHNQRKIVRDDSSNIFVVFVDTINQSKIIKGVLYHSNMWGTPYFICNGLNPTIAISDDNTIYLVYESNDSTSKIMYRSTLDYITWSSAKTISDSAYTCIKPVADVDSSGTLNIFWIRKTDSLSESIIYAKINDDTLNNHIIIDTKYEINDIAIANHLNYGNDVLIFAVQYNQDSINYFISSDHMSTIDTIYSCLGSQPCITYNSYNGTSDTQYDIIRLLYLDNGQLTEVETHYNDLSQKVVNPLFNGQTDYVCIDNITPDIGYSFLYVMDGLLSHAFSYGMIFNWYPWFNNMNFCNYPNSLNPSIAYKHFNFLFVDFIWMENNGNGYNIFYTRDEKHIWMSVEDIKEDKGFSITGFPNPFNDKISISVKTENKEDIPVINIYNTKSQLIKKLDFVSKNKNIFNYELNAKDCDGNTPGVYIVQCICNKIKTARKIILTN